MKLVLYGAAKRMMDILGSLVALIIFAPISLAIIAAIKFEDGGPTFYSQERIGYKGRPFVMWKFRSMVVGAHSMKSELEDLNETEGPIFKVKNDPRVTKVGVFIRKHSLDEIPQFVNVLKGDMSLVGPRPALPEEVLAYGDSEKERLKAWPGLTGLWQVSGRSNLNYDQMIALDLKYVENKSLIMDIKILFATVIQMFLADDSGAY
nr:sugar transferase [Weissella confusa]